MSTRQKNDESTDDLALTTENRLHVYTAIGGTVLFPGVTEYVSQEEYGKGYEYLSTVEKVACHKISEERMMAMILFKNADSTRFRKLQKEIHDDYLKSQDKSVSMFCLSLTSMLLSSSSLLIFLCCFRLQLQPYDALYHSLDIAFPLN